MFFLRWEGGNSVALFGFWDDFRSRRAASNKPRITTRTIGETLSLETNDLTSQTSATKAMITRRFLNFLVMFSKTNQDKIKPGIKPGFILLCFRGQFRYV